MKQNRLFLLAAFVFITCLGFGQNIEWQKCLGGTRSETPTDIQQTSDGGYILIGTTNSDDGDISGSNGTTQYITDIWVVKQNSLGMIQWQVCLGGYGNDAGYSIQQTFDGGYILIGETYSTGHGQWDVWVAKLTSTGVTQWSRCFGGSSNDNGYYIQQTADSGYIFTGFTSSWDGDLTGYNSNGGLQSLQAWVVKLSSTGLIQWHKCLGGPAYEEGHIIKQCTDGSYILLALTASQTGSNHGQNDIWVVKLNSTGFIQWQKCFGGTDDESGFSIEETSDGGYILVGETFSNNGDVSGNHNFNGISRDVWVVKLNSAGTLKWQNCLGGTSDDIGYDIQQTADSGYILTGITRSDDGDVTGSHDTIQYGGEVWIVKLNPTGTIQWQKCLGGTNIDVGNSIHQTSDGGYILAGGVISNDGDVSGNKGGDDVWVVKLGDICSVQTGQLSVGEDITICHGDTITLQASLTNGNNPPYSYSWNNGNTSANQTVSPNSTTNYILIVSDSTNCILKDTVLVIVNPIVPIVDINGQILTCLASGYSYQWFLNGNIIVGATNQSYTATQNGAYTVQITNASGCSNISAITNITNVALDKALLTHLSVYPNPVNREMLIVWNEATNKHLKIELMDLSEKIILTKEIGHINQGERIIINMEPVASGLYVLKLQGEEKIYISKIVKE